MVKKFNIRVYGLLVENDKILVADELVKGLPVTKFPGGGLELGEGTKDCLIREFMEETGFAIEVIEHFYTTDFFQLSAFNEEDQIVSIYYKVNRLLQTEINTENHTDTKTIIDFRWVSLKNLATENICLPIDKYVSKLLVD